MQSTGQASTQAVSLVPMQGSAITYAIDYFPESLYITQAGGETQFEICSPKTWPADSPPTASRSSLLRVCLSVYVSLSAVSSTPLYPAAAGAIGSPRLLPSRVEPTKLK